MLIFFCRAKVFLNNWFINNFVDMTVDKNSTKYNKICQTFSQYLNTLSEYAYFQTRRWKTVCQKSNMSKIMVFQKQNPESIRKTNYFCWNSEVHIWWIIYYSTKPQKRLCKSNATDASNNIVDVLRLHFYRSLPILILYRIFLTVVKFQTKYYYTVFNLGYKLLWNNFHSKLLL